MQQQIRTNFLRSFVGASEEDINISTPSSRPFFSLFDLKCLARKSHLFDTRQKFNYDPTLSSYLSYCGQLLANLAYTFFFQFGLIFIDPLNFFLTVFSSMQMIILLLIVQIAFFIYKACSIDEIFREWSKRYASNMSLVNWDDPTMYRSKRTKRVVKEAKGYLENFPNNGSKLSVKEFGEEEATIAQLMTVLCGLMYERDDEAQDEEGSLQRIQEIASFLKLNVDLASDIRNKKGSPYCALFWSENHNFIIVAFKGTTPENYQEWLVDASYQRTDGNSFLFGQVHEGFFKALFSNVGGSSDDYNAHVEIIRKLSDRIQQMKSANATQVWITGHSLGGALAILFFTRLISSPGDIREKYLLRDCYAIGSAVVGDPTFASKFEGILNSDRTSTENSFCYPSRLWRIVLEGDIVPTLPQVLFPLTPSVEEFLSRHSIMNYVFNFEHVGNEVLLRQKDGYDGVPPTIQIGQGVPAKLRLRDRSDMDETFEEDLEPQEPPTKLVIKAIPKSIQNHLPSRYYHNLTSAKKFLGKKTQVEFAPRTHRKIDEN